MPRTAAFLFVHNDADTIGWWIAHHAAVGFSALFICDDHSTDGTWNVLTNATAFHDLRLSRSTPDLAVRKERETQALRRMLQEAGPSFDWAIILAADEFLCIEDQSLCELLSTQDEKTDRIPVNWCIHGTAGDGTGPGFSPLEAYPRHAKQDFHDHRLTRTFIRTNVIPRVLPDPFIQIETAPDWSQARIRHYAAATLRRRLDAGDETISPEAVVYFDRNDVNGEIPEKIVRKSERMAASILQTGLTDLHWRIKNILDPESDHELARIWSETQNSNSLLPASPVVFHAVKNPDGTDKHDLVFAVEQADTRHTLLFSTSPDQEPFLRLPGSPTLLAAVPLQQTGAGHFLSPVSGLPVSLDISGNAVLEQTAALSRRLESLRALTRFGNTMLGLLTAIERLPCPDPTALGCAIAFLPPQEARKLANYFPGLVSPMVLPASTLA